MLTNFQGRLSLIRVNLWAPLYLGNYNFGNGHLAIGLSAIGHSAIELLAIGHLAIGTLATGHSAIGISAINVNQQSSTINPAIFHYVSQ